MDERSRKQMTMHKALHPKDDVDRLYVSRKGGGRGIASIRDSFDASIQWLEEYIEKHGERLILQPPETILTTRGLTGRR